MFNLFFRKIHLIFIFLLAFTLRTYNLPNHSITFDEYIFISNTHIFSFSQYMEAFFSHHPDYSISPLTPIIIYIITWLFPNSVVVWRLFYIFFGIGAVLLTYFLGKKLYGEKAGALASFYLSLSPFSIWISQEIKCYAICLFLSLLSLYSLVNFLKEKNKLRWLILGSISNLLLPWLHSTYIFIPFTEIFILAIYFPQERFKNYTLWALQSFLACLTWTVWYFYLDIFTYNAHEPHKEYLTFYKIFETLFCFDSVGLSPDLLPEWKTNALSVVEGKIWRNLLNHWWICDYTLAFLLFCTVMIYIISMLIRGLRNSKYDYFPTITIILSVVWFVLIQLFTQKPALTIQYFLQIIPLSYISIGAILIKINKKYCKILLSGLLLICLSLQSLSLVCFKNRTDYMNASKYIEKELPLKGFLLGQRFSTVYDVVKFYINREDITYVPIHSLEGFVEKGLDILFNPHLGLKEILIFLELHSIQCFGFEDPVSLLTQHFETKGASIEWKIFPGEYNIAVGKVRKKADKPSCYYPSSNLPPLSYLQYEEMAREFDLLVHNPIERENYIKTLRKNFIIYPILPIHYVLIISNLISENQLEVAEKICSRLIETYPKFGLLYLLKSLTLLKRGNTLEAGKYAKKGFEISPNTQKFYGKIINELIAKNGENTPHCCELLKILDKKGFVFLDKALLSFCGE